MNTHRPSEFPRPLLGILLALFLLGCGAPEASDAGEHEHPSAQSESDQAHVDHTPTEGQEGHGDPDALDHGSGMVEISGELARRLGVTLTRARSEELERSIRATGEVVWDETRMTTVSLRFGGWAEHLHADFTGRFVRAGEPLLDVYSPELVSAQEDLLAAARLAGTLTTSRVPGSVDRGSSVVEAARERLRYWNISEADIQAVEESGEVQSTLTLTSPFGGYVVEKEIQAGERFEAGTPLYRLADLSRVWVEVDVYERDLRFIELGTPVEVEVVAYPGDAIQGVVSYIHPDVSRDRRTARVRIELPNPEGLLKPGMAGTARAQVSVTDAAVTVPRDAVMHTGDGAVVFVGHDGGFYEIRSVQVGAEAGDRTQILSGLEEGEAVVSRAGFILDAESRLMEAMMGQPGMPGMEMDHGDDHEMDADPEHRDHGDPDDHDDHEDPGDPDDHGGHDDHNDHADQRGPGVHDDHGDHGDHEEGADPGDHTDHTDHGGHGDQAGAGPHSESLDHQQFTDPGSAGDRIRLSVHLSPGGHHA